LHVAKRELFDPVQSAEVFEVGGYYGWGYVHQAGAGSGDGG
jgi:hypothetical protein